jgi:L-ascorbate metabolism protein UlaG (beta-lactamase superfamily)
MPDTESDSVLFIGNATLLIRYAGFTLLTDPTFVHAGESVDIGYGMSTKRLVEPAMDIDDLPPLDGVVLSHFHGDHFDQVAEDGLDRDVPIITTPQAAAILDDKGFRSTAGLETWSTYEADSPDGSLRVTALPGRHAPLGLSVALPDVMGSYLELTRSAGDTVRIYITGDTLMYEGIREIAERIPKIDLAFLHLGGTRVMGVTVTMDADQGIELMRMVEPRRAVPIHYNDFDAFKDPLESFVDRVRELGLESQVQYVTHGDSVDLARMGAAL